MDQGRIIIISAPSGAGKTTVVKAMMERLPQLMFSISATTRPLRGHEKDGVDYYFLSTEAFQQRIAQNHFVEWEEVYPGRYYGTLLSEVDRILGQGGTPLFDVDVVGGLNLKRQFGQRALCLFINPPSLETLRQRLQHRGTESPEEIERRMSKAAYELSLAPQFDHIVTNDHLQQAIAEAETLIRQFLQL